MKFHLPVKLTQAAAKVANTAKVNSPKLLIFGGAGCLIAAGIYACKQTLNVEGIIDEHLEEKKNIEEALEQGVTIQNENYPEPTVYTEEIAKKDKFHLMCRTGGKLFKNYILVVILGAVGLGLIGKGVGIFDGRLATMTAVATAFEEKYRNSVDWVRDEYGEEAAQKAATAKKVKSTEETVDEDGNTQTVEKEEWVYGTEYGDYAVMYDKYNAQKNWDKSDYYNRQYLEGCERTANDRLTKRGHIMLSEIYDMLGVDRTPASLVCGWLYDKDGGPNQVRFIYRDIPKNEFDLNDGDPAHWIDFNVQGVIWDKIPRYNAN